MSGRFKPIYVAVLIATGAVGNSVMAQTWQPFGPMNHVASLAPFETFDIRNFEARPDPKEGFFFQYDRLYWSFTGENVPVGDPSVNDVVSIDLNPGLSQFPPTPILNGLLNGPPDSSFAWGHRYEFGYINDHHGWECSVLDAPKTNDRHVYGFGERQVNTVNPASGSVQILFNIPPEFAGLLDGFVDLDLDGIQDQIITYIITFDSVTVQSQTETQGVELMKTYRFDPTTHGSLIEFAYGARYLRIRDDFRVDTTGNPVSAGPGVAGPIGTSFWDTRIDNQMVGPQVGLSYSNQRGRWNFEVSGRGMLSLNVQNLKQEGSFGDALRPYSNFSPFYFNPTTFASKRQEEDFSPVVEMRVSTSYQLTKAISLQAGWNALFVDNIRRAAVHVDYTLPNFGIKDAGTQEIFVNGLNFGIAVNH